VSFYFPPFPGTLLTYCISFGDALDAFMAMMVYRTCQQVEGGLPAAVQSQMVFNIVIDFFIGLVPFIGDLADGKLWQALIPFHR
jgi:hypothetical protein